MSKIPKLLLLLAIITMINGCANIQRSEMPVPKFSSLDCPAIANQLEQARATQQHATEAKRNSWKVIIPIAIGVRYINASMVKNEAEDREAYLVQEQRAKDCTSENTSASN